MNKEIKERRKVARAAHSDGVEQQLRLIAKIEALGGKRPEPWPWAINKITYRKGRATVFVDTALYNLQLLELLEDLVGGKVHV